MPKVRRQLSPLLANASYAAIRLVVASLGTANLGATLAIAAATGRAYARAPFNRKRLARATDNLAVAFPGWTDQQRHDHAIRAYEHLLMLGVEVANTPRLVTADAYSTHIELVEIEPIVHSVLGSRPIIFICGHTGNWEICGYALAQLGLHLHALYRPLDLKPMDSWLRRTRARSGIVLVDKYGASQVLPPIMTAKNPVGFVADQNAGDKGLFVPFFGRMASTYKAIALLALQFDAVIVVGAAHRKGGNAVTAGIAREPEGLRYTMKAFDVFGPEEYRAAADPAFYITARYRRAIEISVRAAPEQYLWMHRYWKSRPKWERDGKPLPKTVQAKIEALPWMTQSDLDRLLAFTESDSRAYQLAHPASSPAEAPDLGD